jgi:hypothetical protein
MFTIVERTTRGAILLFGLTAATVSMAFPWGSTAHHLINLKAPMDLPSSMGTLKADSLFYAAHASDPDYRKNSSDTSFWAEAPRHFIDIDWYPNFHSLPHSLDSVIALYGRSTVRNQGLNPWATVMVLDSLTAQIRRGDAARIETTMSDLGHYVADAHQPLHCTKNYDGQLTGNSGIHSRYETTMINDYQNSIIIHSDSIHYISSPIDFIFDYTYHSNLYVDSIMQADTYAKAVSGWSGSGTAPASYYAALWLKVGGFTTDQIQQATVDLASLWYTAWVNAQASASPFDSIFTTAFGNGQVTPSGIVVIPATHDTTFSFTPQSAYHVDSVLVDGVRTDSLVAYTFYNVVSNHALKVWFSINKDTITAAAGSNGSISPSGSVNVNYGANQQFIIIPTTGYHVDSVIVDGVRVDSTTSYTFINVTAGHTIRTTYKINSYTITAAAGSNGSISPSGSVNVNYGGNQQFMIIPNTGYHVDSVIVDGVEVDTTTSYTFINDTANHTIRAAFKIDSYTIIIKSDSSTLGAAVSGGRLDSSYVADLVFTAVDVGAFGTWTPVPPGAPPETQVINISPGNGQNGFLKTTFNLPASFGNASLDGSANVDDDGRAFLNGHPITPSIFSGDPGVITEFGNARLLSSDQSFFKTGQNELLVSDENNSGPSGAAFYAYINYENNPSIIATASAHGSISPTDTVYVSPGVNQRFTITPDSGYHVDSVIVDGVKVDSTTGYTFINVTAGHTIRVTFRQTAVTLSLNVRSRWNMVSIPVTVADKRKSALFPSAISSAFAHEGTYAVKDTLANGVGYWLKFTDTQTVAMTGVPITQDTTTVQEGWNMIGSISTPVATTQLTSDPGGIVTSQAFGYEGRYVTSDSIQPGKGYWVKVNQSGKLILASSQGMISASNRIRIMPREELPPAAPDDNEPLSVIPKTYALEQNYPNPFNPATSIRFALPKSSYVTLKVFNLLGQEVAALLHQQLSAGYHEAMWEASNTPSGMYFYRLQTNEFTQTRKLLLLK